MEIDLQRPFNKSAKILIIGDSDTDITPLKGLLEKEGYEFCTGIEDPRLAVGQFIADPPDLLLLDWHMELLSGEEVLIAIKDQVPEEQMPPVLIITPDRDVDIKRQALRLGGTTDFLTKPLDYVEVLLRIRNLLHLRMLHLRVQSENTRLENKVLKRTQDLEKSVIQLKDSQNQIIQQERLHALGAMAGGVAHDFNNALMIILGFSDQYLHASDAEISKEPVKVRESLEVITRAATDAVEIVRRLGEFYRPNFTSKTERVKVCVNTICEEASQLCEPKWQTQSRNDGVFIDLRTELGETPEIAAAPSELREMLMNLIFNAVDAMPQGGQILLRTSVEENYVMIEVEDSGTGMTEETRVRCMEPFYTTKGDRGTGLGLAIIYGIVRRHQGLIRIATELNKGTKFTFCFQPLPSMRRPSRAKSLRRARRSISGYWSWRTTPMSSK